MTNLAYLLLLARLNVQAAPPANFGGVEFRVRRTNYQLRFMLKHRAIEPVLSRLLSLCDQDTLFLDIGANIGLFSLLIAAQRGSTCLAFEPVRSTFACLVENCHANPHLNVSCFNSAIGQHPGQVRITALPLSGINNIQPLEDRGQGHQESPVQSAFQITLDQLQLADLAVGHGKLVIKIDVEHYELDVLRGAQASLAINQPLALCIETDPSDLPAIHKLLGDDFQPIEPPFHPGLSRTTDGDMANHFFVNRHWPASP
jgi:FkbM family methyltransferase